MLTAWLSSASPDFPGTPSLLHAWGEVLGLRLLSPFPALLLGVVVPAAASSAPAPSWDVYAKQTAWLVDFGENRDAVSISGVCKLLPCKYSAENMR